MASRPKAHRTGPAPSKFAERGFALFMDALDAEELGLIEGSLGETEWPAAGTRLRTLAAIRPLLSTDGKIGCIAASLIGAPCRPVRAILFDKSPELNWSLGWHQDRTIAVAARVAMEGFERWTVKDGIHHVEPPFGILEQMVTLRIHLDPVDASNAPLMVAPGSHLLGRLIEADIDRAVEACGSVACLAGRGDVWAYATPILHASAASDPPKRRRVLQVDYSADGLPEPLSWLTL